MLTSCSSEQKKALHHKQREADSQTLDRIIPLKVDQNEFQKIAGWLATDTVAYIKKVSDESQVYAYNLTTGEQKLLFKTTEPIIDVHISPTYSKLLIHTAPFTYAANIYIINHAGTILYEKTIDSFEIEFSWNNQDDNLVLITAFFEDWSYEVKLLHIAGKTLKTIEVSQPFQKWFHKDMLISQGWDAEEADLHAPLVGSFIDELERKNILLEDIYYFDTFSKLLFAITVSEEEEGEATYHFYNEKLNEIGHVKVPLLISQYSDWLIPYYDLMPAQKSFLYFTPYQSDDEKKEDTYRLIQYDLENKKQYIIGEQLGNAPISCAANSKNCLYGFQFEKLIRTDSNEIVPLVITNETSS